MGHRLTQCVILVGGLGSRLGEHVRYTPKPMLDVAGEPFLAHLMREISRFGFSRFLLLAGYRADVVKEFFSAHAKRLFPADLSVEIVVEPEPLGTAGALRSVADMLDDQFLLCNGDSFCDCNVLRLIAPFRYPDSLVRMALRPVSRNSRYGAVLVDGSQISGFRERSVEAGPGLMNTGLYQMSRKIIDVIGPGKKSLETDIFPSLAEKGMLEHHIFAPSFFIDIGVEEDLARARTDLPHVLRRSGAFLDFDLFGARFSKTRRWIDGAQESILAINDAGYLAFAVIDQTSPALDRAATQEMRQLHDSIQNELSEIGAHIDAFICAEDVVQWVGKNKSGVDLVFPSGNLWNIDYDGSFFIGGGFPGAKDIEIAGVRKIAFDGCELPGVVSLLLQPANSGEGA